jgi:hypothetical protein
MRAFLLDGTQYYAALFIGDTYYKQQKPAFAGAWFAQAIGIDPNKETAYRYWGVFCCVSKGSMRLDPSALMPSLPIPITRHRGMD